MRANRGRASRRRTFSAILAEVRQENLSRVFMRAKQANALAKCLRRRMQRDLAYRIKNNAIFYLMSRSAVEVTVDHERYPGLLSVKRGGLGRLHTHESLLRDYTGAYERRRLTPHYS